MSDHSEEIFSKFTSEVPASAAGLIAAHSELISVSLTRTCQVLNPWFDEAEQNEIASGIEQALEVLRQQLGLVTAKEPVSKAIARACAIAYVEASMVVLNRMFPRAIKIDDDSDQQLALVRDCESLLASISLSFQDSLIEASDEDLELAREHFSEHDLSNFFDLTVLCFLPVMNATWSSAPGSASAAKQRELASAAMKGALVELYQVLYLAILDVEDPRCLFSLGRAFGNLGGVSLTANAAALAYLEEQGVDTKTGRENLTTLENGFEDLAERLFN